jgi:hypothetical protein
MLTQTGQMAELVSTTHTIIQNAQLTKLSGYGARLRYLNTISWSRKWRGFESHSVQFFFAFFFVPLSFDFW